MSTETDNLGIKRWTAKRKSMLVLSIIKGQTTSASAAREYDLPLSEVESWVSEAHAGMENALRAKPRDIKAQYEAKLDELTSAYGEAMLENKALKKLHALLNEEESSC